MADVPHEMNNSMMSTKKITNICGGKSIQGNITKVKLVVIKLIYYIVFDVIK